MQESLSGLSSVEAAELLKSRGPNSIEEKKPSLLKKVWRWTANPMSVMFILAAALSLWAGHGTDALIIAALFLTNIGVGAWHEAKADSAIEKLRAKLSVVVKVKRDGLWTEAPSARIVPGDLIKLQTGDLIAADVEFLEADNVSVNESVLTGESLPKEKKKGDKGFSGSFLSTGLALARVSATGSGTFFGETLTMVDKTRRISNLERDILSISKFLAVISLAVMSIMTFVLILADQPLIEIATLDVSMLIAGIPVALPTVMTLIISVGVIELTAKSVIIRRLSSLEDLANVNLLLSDKTGTLTENKIKVAGMIPLDGALSEKRIWSLASAVTPEIDTNPLAEAVREKIKTAGAETLSVENFIPGDSERKRATVVVGERGGKFAVALGAPQTVAGLCSMDGDLKSRYDSEVAKAGRDGYRILALAVSADEREVSMKPAALFLLADAVRSDAKETLDFLKSYGIAVKMVTGDGRDVAAHVLSELGLQGRIAGRDEFESRAEDLKRDFASLAGFAEVTPKDKFEIVNLARKAAVSYTVAVTGDGVNDVPPVKTADVGIAVSNAVDALKATADIVLTRAGIAVIKDALVESRKIFLRLYNYSVYRISESFRLIVTIAVIGVLFHTFPLTPVQIILIALLNDVPIISLAFDRVAVPRSPASINVRRRLVLSTLYGLVGIGNSLVLLWIAVAFLNAPWAVIQTLFFLKLTVSGHMLVYVAHTDRPWYSFLPSKQVIWATTVTQAVATVMAVLGIFVAPISLAYAAFVWLWSLLWMQIGEGVKQVYLHPKE